jgi:hypothetical protein
VIVKILILFIVFFPNGFGLSPLHGSTSPKMKASTPVKKTLLSEIKLKEVSPQDEFQKDPHTVIQIQADKDHGVFVSVDQTLENERKARREFAFSSVAAYRILDDKLQNRDEDIERWSQELARYRFAKSYEDKLFLIKELLDDAVDSGDYTRVDHLINCDSLKFQNFLQHVIVSFHPTVYVEDGISLGGDNSDVMNIQMQKEFEKLKRRTGETGLKGVLYAWNPHEALLQYCDVFIPH